MNVADGVLCAPRLLELTAAGFVPEAAARSLVRVSGAAEFIGLLR